MKASQPQKLTYSHSGYHVYRSKRAQALHAFFVATWSVTSGLCFYIKAMHQRVAKPFYRVLPSYAHLLAPKPRHMLWDLRYVSGYTPHRRQPYRPVELVTFAPVHAFFHGIFRNRNGNALTIIRHRNEFNPAASRCTY